MAKNRRVNIKVTSNVTKVLKESGAESSKAGKQSAGALGKIKGMLGGVTAGAAAATGGIRAFTMALISSGVGAFVVAAGAMVALFTKAIGESKEFEKALSGLKAITGATSEEMSALSQDAKALGASTAFTASQVVQLQTEFSKLGFNTAEILDATAATLALAAASGTDLADAAMVSGNTIRAFGFDAAEAGRVSDVMAKSFTTSALDMEKFRESMKLVAPIAKVTKVSLEESSAALAVLADRGISGSMAGTQLRRVMSDLATKTGKSFQESLEITADRLANASTTAEKLAIAKKLVGDRAKGSLIALAENRDALNDLKLAYENAGGAAQKMADEQLNNLAGDITILSSAWSGFLLGIEDGEGVLNKISRGAIQLLTKTLTFLNEASTNVADSFRVNFASMKRIVSTVGERLSATFTNIGLNIELFALKAKEAISDIPLIGKAIDKEALQANMRAVESELKASNERLKVLTNNAANEAEMRELHRLELQEKRKTKIKADNLKKAPAKIEEFVEGAVGEIEDDPEAKRLAAIEEFKRKLKKKTDDFDAKSYEDKVLLERDRHLAELETLKLNKEEKEQLNEQITQFYEAKRTEARAKDLEKVQIEEIKTRDAEVEAAREKRADIEATRQLEIQAKMDVLDTAARIAGEETALGKAMLIAKNILRLKDLVETAKAAAVESGIKAGLSMQEIGKGSAKALATLNPAIIAGYAISAVAVVGSIIKTMKATKKAAADAGGGGGSDVAVPSINTGASLKQTAPSFNVIGKTSNDANLVANAIGKTKDTPLKAYVVETEITNAQELNRRAEGQASLG